MEVSVINGYDLKDKKAKRYYDNVQSMKTDTLLKLGMFVETKGYYECNDGGKAIYHIVEDTDKYYESLTNGLKAELIIETETVNIKQLGAKGDGTTDDTEKIQIALNNFNNIFIPEGTFLISSITLKNSQKIKGENWEKSIIKSIANNNETSIITCQDGAVRTQIIDLAIHGNKANNTNVIDGIHMYKSAFGTDPHTYIHNVRVFQCTGNGIKMTRQLESRISHCICNNNDKNGILYVNTSDACIEDTTCSSNYENGINVTTGANRIINCKCFYNGFIPNSEYNERKSGFYISGANNSITCCHAQENAGHGFEFGESNEITMQGCCADNNGLYLDENRTVINLPEGVDPLYDGVYCNHVRRSYIECTGRNFHLSNGASQRYTLNFANGTECGLNTFVVSSGNQLISDFALNDSARTHGTVNGVVVESIINIGYRFLSNPDSISDISVDNDFPLTIREENGYIHVQGGIKFTNELLVSHGEVGVIKILNTDKYNIESLVLNVVAYPTSLFSNPIGLINGRMATDGSIKVRNRDTDRGIKKVAFDFTYRPVKQAID